ncbi:hypothetical protein NPIL_538321 [Nephila pilipes]|uniref:Uncharacterized protein n=1 Tax=Nephila pilipes TaxID=299642 RepID=A0A8X6NU20_NEPPI|nr:hypothetical protein NPIL_538321 [Nephila pilipes]
MNAILERKKRLKQREKKRLEEKEVRSHYRQRDAAAPEWEWTGWRSGAAARRNGARSGRGRGVEAHPAEHVHAMGQRAPEDGGQAHHQPRDGPLGRTETHRSRRGAVRKTPPETQQKAHV